MMQEHPMARQQVDMLSKAHFKKFYFGLSYCYFISKKAITDNAKCLFFIFI